MLHEIDLRALTDLAATERGWLTFYLDGSDDPSELDRRGDRIRTTLEEDDEDDDAVSFEENIGRIRQWLEDHPPEADENRSTVVFACWANDQTIGYTLDVSLSTRLRIGPGPFVRPIAEAQEEYEPFLVVVSDNHRTRIYTVTADEVEEEKRLRGKVKNRVKKGGWSQARYARRREKQIERYVDDISDHLGRIASEGGAERIVLLGSDETLRELSGALPNELEEKVIGRGSVDDMEDVDQIVADAYEIFWETEREEERSLWKRIKAEVASDGLGVLGAKEVLDALKLGRVDEMLVTRDATASGTRCRACRNQFAETVDTCPACESQDVYESNLIEALVEECERTGAAVEFSDPIKGLTKAGDVAAHLRY